MNNLAALIVAVAAAASPAAASVQNTTEVATQKVISEAKEMCERFDNGKFSMTPKAISVARLSSDTAFDTIIDSKEFKCSTMATAWGGTGGDMLWVIVDGKAHSFLAKEWKTIGKVLSLRVHPGLCRSGPEAKCYKPLVYANGKFETPKPTLYSGVK